MFTIRPLNPNSDREMNTVVAFSVMTLWESRPELRVDPATVPDFGFASTRSLYQQGVKDPTQQFLIALDHEARIVGHSIINMRTGNDGTRFGYFWSRYVLPEARRKGLSRAFYERAMSWFAEQSAETAEVHVHVDNTVLRNIYEALGFSAVDRGKARWEYIVYRADL